MTQSHQRLVYMGSKCPTPVALPSLKSSLHSFAVYPWTCWVCLVSHAVVLTAIILGPVTTRLFLHQRPWTLVFSVPWCHFSPLLNGNAPDVLTTQVPTPAKQGTRMRAVLKHHQGTKSHFGSPGRRQTPERLSQNCPSIFFSNLQHKVA